MVYGRAGSAKCNNGRWGHLFYLRGKKQGSKKVRVVYSKSSNMGFDIKNFFDAFHESDGGSVHVLQG